MTSFVKAGVGDGAMTLDAHWYTSADVFAREREQLFARGWTYVARAEQVANVGDFILVDVSGESLIIVRDAQRVVRAFFNVCRHRGTQVCTQPQGRFSGSIQCPYHAWTYGLDGSLLAARNMHEIESFDRADYPLVAARVATFGGFLFVNLSADATAFEHTYAALDERFAPWNLAGLRVAQSIEYELACNWKLVFQNYSECYHCPLVHPQLDKLSPSDSGRNDLDAGPILGGYSEMRERGTSLTMSGRRSRTPVGTVADENLERVFYYTIFPSLLLSLHPDYAMMHHVEPMSAERTKIVCRWLFDPDTMAGAAFDPSDVVEFWDITNRQDWHVNELTQRGILSRAYRSGPYANAEGLLAAFDRYYIERMTDRVDT